MGLRMSAAWGCAGAQHGGAHGRSMGPRTGAQWCCARAHNGAMHRRTMVLCRSAAWGCACGVPRGVHGGGGGASPQAFGVSPAEALTRKILVPGLQARCVASPQAADLAL